MGVDFILLMLPFFLPDPFTFNCQYFFSFDSLPFFTLFLCSFRCHIHPVMADWHMIGYHVESVLMSKRHVSTSSHQMPWQRVMPFVTCLTLKHPNLLSSQLATVYQSIIQVNSQNWYDPCIVFIHKSFSCFCQKSLEVLLFIYFFRNFICHFSRDLLNILPSFIRS